MPRSRTRASSSPAAYGTATSTSSHSDASSAAISARSVSRPNPVAAETRTEPAHRRRRLRPVGARVQEVGLVERGEPRLVAGAELVEDRLDRRPVLGAGAVRGVDDLDQHVGPGHLLERRPERVDELVRAACG